MVAIHVGLIRASVLEKGFVLLVSYFMADIVNSFVEQITGVDSFILTNSVGVTIIYVVLAGYFYMRGQNNGMSKSKVL